MNRQTIKSILLNLPKGTTLTVGQIQNEVQNHCLPVPDDWKPYTPTRPTNYPKWHHEIQGVLYELKEKRIIIHHPSNSSYTF